jgi:hypothetical protein
MKLKDLILGRWIYNRCRDGDMYFLPDRIDGTASIHGFSIYLPNELVPHPTETWIPEEPEDIYFGSIDYIWSPGARSGATSLSEFRLATPEDFKRLINQILPQTLHLHFDKSYKGDRSLYMWFAYSGGGTLTGIFRLSGYSIFVKTKIKEIEISNKDLTADLNNGSMKEANQDEIDTFYDIVRSDSAAIHVMSDLMFVPPREPHIGYEVVYKSNRQ